MRKILLLLLIASCASCKSYRNADICILDTVAGIANCATPKKEYTLRFPDKLEGWSAFDTADFLYLGNVLEQCEADGKLPPHNYIGSMDICTIGPLVCGTKSHRAIDGFYAVDKFTLRRIQQRINDCMRPR
jgi:hypothetical protein